MGELGPLAAGMGKFGQRSCLWRQLPGPTASLALTPNPMAGETELKKKTQTHPLLLGNFILALAFVLWSSF